MSRSLLVFIQLLILAAANVEKTIFVAPAAVAVSQDAAIDNLLLERLHPNRLTVRTFLNASFPTNDKPHGENTWALLEGLSPNQRYELRVCWLATQPTAFSLDTYSLTEAFETAELITSLTTYSYARHAQLSQADIDALQAKHFSSTSGADQSSLLFLRIQAAADYFSLNETLMKSVPPVHVDLILDPYLLNVFPQSLIPTAGYIAAIAVLSWFLSGWTYRQMTVYVRRNQERRAAQLANKKSR
ncbi:hypothetical protein LTR70_008771 [Exophiala xenobiotica]|uniref:Uncharacterized protein n=1 Tax=Lithohypha guttulata TaxID=1690604 RepID=A0ABR0JZZ0_9EURO|nr:hypothetical protein LTR24_008455 [Lithohypha guttulata]KAK5311480.1 hypothetical protein LTR70_008771 [Exophiala xenobiotica]